MNIHIRPMTEADIDAIIRTFSSSYWRKERAQYERYWAEQQGDQRSVFVAWEGERVVGYVTLVWLSGYEPFSAAGIPEIVDLNVDPPYRQQGIGTRLIRTCEAAAQARGCGTIGIAVVLDDPDYAAARRLYPALGYVPDGEPIGTDHDLPLTRNLSTTGAPPF
jgi:predicted N-acetyltransferase YhbS